MQLKLAEFEMSEHDNIVIKEIMFNDSALHNWLAVVMAAFKFESAEFVRAMSAMKQKLDVKFYSG